MFPYNIQRKYSTIFAKVALFAFVFAWITCTSHISLTSHVSGTTASEHSEQSEESPLAHNETCIDHTQFSARTQSGDYHNDFTFLSAVTESVDFSFTLLTVEDTTLPVTEFDSGQRLFLQNTVLRI